MTVAAARREFGGVCLLLGIATCLVFRRWLFTGQALYWGDTVRYFVPLARFLRAQLLHGTIPLWNPQIFGGVPFVGNPQVWPLYPTTPLLALLPGSAFLTVGCVLHVFLAGLFGWLWLRAGRAALPFWPALLGAVSYMFGGYLVTKAQYPNMLQALAWVPLVLWRTERLVLAPRWGSAVALGAALGLQVLAAHAQITLYTLYLALADGLFCLAVFPARRFLPTLAGAAGAGLLALSLSCGQWLPILAARQWASRQDLSLAGVNRLHLSPIELTNFALPWRYGSPLHGDYVGPGAFWETACYAGTLTLALACVFLLTRLRRDARHRGEALFWALIFVLSVWLALGGQGGLFRLAYVALPGFRLFHDPARLLLSAALALPVLGARGLEWVLGVAAPRVSPARLGLAVVLLSVIDLGQFDNGLYPLMPVSQLENLAASSPIAGGLRADPALRAGTGRLLTLDDPEANNRLVDWTDFRPPPHYLGRLTDTGLTNLPAAADIAQAGGYEPLVLRGPGVLSLLALSLMRAQGADQSARPDLAARTAPLLGLMAVREVMAYRPQPLRFMPGLTPVLARRNDSDLAIVYRNDDFVPRARLYSSWQTAAAPVAPEAVVAAWLSPGADPALLDRPWVAGAPPSHAPAAPPTTLRILRDSPDRVTLGLPPLSAPAVCVLTDTDFPGWRATLDGRPVPVLPADGVYRAVFVPHSAHTLDFRYRPEAFVLGFYLTGVAALFLAAYGAFRLTPMFLRRGV